MMLELDVLSELLDEVRLIRKGLSPRIRKPEEVPKYMGTEETIAFLKENGFAISRSKLYKMTCTDAIPCNHFGRKLLFNKMDLHVWCESNINFKIIKNDNNENGK